MEPVSGPVDVASVANVDDGHRTGSIVHPVDHDAAFLHRA
jgi:hypothetical protein